MTLIDEIERLSGLDENEKDFLKELLENEKGSVLLNESNREVIKKLSGKKILVQFPKNSGCYIIDTYAFAKYLASPRIEREIENTLQEVSELHELTTITKLTLSYSTEKDMSSLGRIVTNMLTQYRNIELNCLVTRMQPFKNNFDEFIRVCYERNIDLNILLTYGSRREREEGEKSIRELIERYKNLESHHASLLIKRAGLGSSLRFITFKDIVIFLKDKMTAVFLQDEGLANWFTRIFKNYFESEKVEEIYNSAKEDTGIQNADIEGLLPNNLPSENL